MLPPYRPDRVPIDPRTIHNIKEATGVGVPAVLLQDDQGWVLLVRLVVSPASMTTLWSRGGDYLVTHLSEDPMTRRCGGWALGLWAL
ncbi:unnamed protein product [Gadus morhua 'NCC']